MGRKKKKQVGGKLGDYDDYTEQSQCEDAEWSPKAYDEDTKIFILMSQEFQDEGNTLFEMRDYEGALLKYEKAINLLPTNHIDVSHIRSIMAASYMQMGVSEYPRAIHECNLALEITPTCCKALLKRAWCYEALNRFDLALRDTSRILQMEPKNFMAAEIEERLKAAIEENGITNNNLVTNLVPVPFPDDYVEPSSDTPSSKAQIEIKQSKNDSKIIKENQISDKTKGKKNKAEDKLVVKEKKNDIEKEMSKKTVKLVFGDDIRRVQIPVDCCIIKLREVMQEVFPSSKGVLIKYRDEEGDIITITTTEELRWAEASAKKHGSLRLFMTEINPEQDPFSDKVNNTKDGKACKSSNTNTQKNSIMNEIKQELGKAKVIERRPSCNNDWIMEFAQLFKNYVGFNSDAYLDLHELGMKLYSKAMEDSVTNKEAQDLFDVASDNFKKMAALALFNQGNVHMSRARKRVYLTEDATRESVLAQVEAAHDWACKEYSEAEKRYEEAVKIKLDFYEGVLALGQLQFERGKLCWYYAVSQGADLETWDSAEVLHLYNNAEENMERGMQLWEATVERHLNELSTPNNLNSMVRNMSLDGFILDIPREEVIEQAANMSSQINILWGTLLYERCIMEFKLGIPVWHECLEVAVEKFELAGASPTDIAVMIKNHPSNDTAQEGLGFNIDEIVQAWNEMHEAKRWQTGSPCFLLEPLLRRRASKLYHALEHS